LGLRRRNFGEAELLDNILEARLEYFCSEQPDWEQIYYQWIAFGLPQEDFYNYPADTILKIWQGVRKCRAEEINAASLAPANIAYMVYEYIRDHEKSAGKDLQDFLPFDLSMANQEMLIDPDSAEIILEARDSGELPPHIHREIIGVKDLYEQIVRLGTERRADHSPDS
jgi:hypothetical protein